MICGLEIAMLVWGIIVMVTGKLKVSKTKEVRGMAARGLAVFMLLPLPLAFLVGVIYGATHIAEAQAGKTPLWIGGVEVILVLGCALAAVIGGTILGKPPQPAATPGGFPIQSANQPPGNQPPDRPA